MIKSALTLILSVFTMVLFGQSNVFHGKLINKAEYSQLDAFIKSYDIYQVDAAEMHNYAMKNKADNLQIQLKLGSKYEFNLDLDENRIFKPGIQVKFSTENGIEKGELTKIKCYNGHIAGSTKSVSISINKNFLFGFVNTELGELFFEPVWHLIPDAPKDQFIFYYAKDYIETKEFKCGAIEMEEHEDHLEDKVKNIKGGAEFAPLGCKEVQMAEASDKKMCEKYGDVFGVQDRITAVLNTVQANYNGSFNDDLTLTIVDFFNVTCTGTDPWTSSTDAGTLLSSFTSWGPTGFSTHDDGELWTNRGFDGGTVGIAWLSSICTANRYNCIQDWTNNANFIRVTVAHEIGHNFSCQHDAAGAPYIMAPSVNSTNEWSSASKSSFNTFVPTRTCLSACTGGTPPTADFEADVVEGCKPLTVNFTDLSTGPPTSWMWTFPGGTPGTSTAKNPTVVYNTPGVFDVTLKATNGAGSNTKTIAKYITVKDKPVASFTFTKNLGFVQFTNTSNGGDDFSWSFGDGEFSNDEDPYHEYLEPGTYTVVFTVSNECGSSTKTQIIEVVFIPEANFSSNISEGCIQMIVNFEDESLFEPTSWFWTFQGGNPATSTNQNPIVSYTSTGMFDVTLVATNSAGSNTIKILKYITAKDKPSPSFTEVIAGYKATFTNTTPGNDNTYLWTFGDGDSSTVKDPVHTYKNSGVFTVKLYVSNSCGTVLISKTITVLAIPKAAFSSNVTTGCVPFSVQYNDLSTNDPTSWKWTFPGGSPATSTLKNPSISYASPGLYSVTLIAINGVGSDTITLNNYMNAITTPTAGFSVVMNGNVAECSNTSTYGNTYLWNFGDGATSTEQNPTHIYAQQGNYTITLTTTNACGSNTTTKIVTVVFPPTAAFSSDKVSGCGPLTVTFNNNSSPDATFFNWTFEGGNPGTSMDENPVVTFANAGTFTVTLIAGNSAGTDTSTIVSYITVLAKPTPSFTYSNSNGFTIFNNTSLNGTSYNWDFGDGTTSTEKNPVHQYGEQKEYTVILTVTNDCGTQVITQLVVVILPPDANFSSDIKAGCNNLTVTFEDLSSPGTLEWAWSFPGGNPATSAEKNPTVTYGSVGSYDVTLIATNSAGSDTIVKPGFILISNAAPIAGFSESNVGLTYIFSNSSSDAYSYEWAFGDGGTSTEKDPSHDYTLAGSYTVQLIAFNGCGSDTTTIQITVEGTPPIGDFENTSGIGCLPLIVSFKDKSIGGATEWNWSFPGGEPATSSDQNPVVIYNEAGVYDVVLIVSNLYGSDTITNIGSINVNGAPKGKFIYVSQGGVVTFTNQSTGGTSYLWNFGDGTTSTEENPVHSYSTPGQFTVSLTVTNECGSFTFTQLVDAKVDVKEIEFIQSLNLYPNPNKGQFVLEIKSTQSDLLQLKMVDVYGKVILLRDLNISAGESKSEFILDNLASGTYMVLIQSGDSLIVKKMIIQN